MNPANPKRFHKNVAGDFYTTGSLIPCSPETPKNLIWCGDCLACEAPEGEAPDLLAKLSDANTDTYFVRQPVNEAETEAACRALMSCCVAALRYGGKNVSITQRLKNSPEFCDYIIAHDGKLIRTLDDRGELLPFAERMKAIINESEP